MTTGTIDGYELTIECAFPSLPGGEAGAALGLVDAVPALAEARRLAGAVGDTLFAADVRSAVGSGGRAHAGRRRVVAPAVHGERRSAGPAVA
jgi:hypothetical protein